MVFVSLPCPEAEANVLTGMARPISVFFNPHSLLHELSVHTVLGVNSTATHLLMIFDLACHMELPDCCVGGLAPLRLPVLCVPVGCLASNVTSNTIYLTCSHACVKLGHQHELWG